MIPVAVLDANILFPMILRDTLLRVAAAGCYRAHWSNRILNEMARNLVAQHRVSEEQAERLVQQMGQAFPETAVAGWQALEVDMPNDPKDRHVAAAAKKIDASLIVTANLRDFAALPSGIEAVAPDTFLLDRLEVMPHEVIAALRRQAAGYRNPPADLGELLDWLALAVPGFAAAARDAVAWGGRA
jgi:predicted nucleic acid-binding protein